ncbi:hypothetical protein AB1N83_013316 [Pleurotus pulmonarius]
MHHTSRPLISRSSSNRPASEPANDWGNSGTVRPRKELTLAHSPNWLPAYLMSDSRANGTHRLSTQAPAKKLSTVSKQHIMNGTKTKRNERSGAQTQGGAGPEAALRWRGDSRMGYSRALWTMLSRSWDAAPRPRQNEGGPGSWDIRFEFELELNRQPQGHVYAKR